MLLIDKFIKSKTVLYICAPWQHEKFKCVSCNFVPLTARCFTCNAPVIHRCHGYYQQMSDVNGTLWHRLWACCVSPSMSDNSGISS